MNNAGMSIKFEPVEIHKGKIYEGGILIIDESGGPRHKHEKVWHMGPNWKHG